MDINYEYYKIFYNVAKYGGFTVAAEKTYSNQPNLTRTIKKLEKATSTFIVSLSAVKV